MEKMNNSSGRQHRPSFFQPYLPQENSASLCIPESYVKNFNGNIPEEILLQNSSDRSWSAKLRYLGNKLHITDGWRSYVHDHSLRSGEFVVLTYLQNSVFLIKVFGTNGVIKQEPPENLIGLGSDVEVDPVMNLRFDMTFRNKNYVGVPKRVLDACVYTLPQEIKLIKDETRDGVRTKLCQTADRVVVGYANVRRFWRMIGVEWGDLLEFKVVLGHGRRIKALIVKNLSQSDVFRRGV